MAWGLAQNQDGTLRLTKGYFALWKLQNEPQGTRYPTPLLCALHALKPVDMNRGASSTAPYPHVRLLSVVHNSRILSIVSRNSTRIVVSFGLLM